MTSTTWTDRTTGTFIARTELAALEAARRLEAVTPGRRTQFRFGVIDTRVFNRLVSARLIDRDGKITEGGIWFLETAERLRDA